MPRQTHPKYKSDLFLYAALHRPAIVYIARNLRNGNCYIGITRTTLAARKNKHIGAAVRGVPGRFYNAIRKHGPETFEFTTIKTCASYNEALAEEVAAIAELKPAYNVTRGGEGALGYKHTKAELERMRLRKLGDPGFWLGKKRSEADRAKMRAARLARPNRYWLGKKRDTATIEKIKQTKRGCAAPLCTPLMEATRIENCLRAAAARRKPVVCISDGRRFESARAAEKTMGLVFGSVANVCNPSHPATTVRGLRFKYTEN